MTEGQQDSANRVVKSWSEDWRFVVEDVQARTGLSANQVLLFMVFSHVAALLQQNTEWHECEHVGEKERALEAAKRKELADLALKQMREMEDNDDWK